MMDVQIDDWTLQRTAKRLWYLAAVCALLAHVLRVQRERTDSRVRTAVELHEHRHHQEDVEPDDGYGVTD